MTALENVKTKLKPGQVYRRSDLEKLSRSVDRDVAGLVNEGVLVKIGSGLYQCPQLSRFGVLPASTDKLLTSFLKDDDYLVTSPNDYNALGLGTTQLYNYQVVYNHKRHGRFELGGQLFDFQRKPRFPKKATPEFLLVDLVNNLSQLAEDRDAVLARVRAKVSEMDAKRLQAAVKGFAKVATRKLFEEALANAA
ncbi:MAG: hypothetical protein HY888_12915 [Deltaproteobacteria bacterium]|nr:hypothetical protein [Deltaproteobacteria bacterium]